MAYDYDKLYQTTPDALGAPTPAIVDFFDALPAAGLRVLDIGCGQGRDALFIARLGHRVVGVDLSPCGIRDLTGAAAKEGLPIEGIVADIATYRPEGTFDVVLIDRTLHMLDAPARLATLADLIGHVAPAGWVFIADEAANMAGFARTLRDDPAPWITTPSKPVFLIAQRG